MHIHHPPVNLCKLLNLLEASSGLVRVLELTKSITACTVVVLAVLPSHQFLTTAACTSIWTTFKSICQVLLCFECDCRGIRCLFGDQTLFCRAVDFEAVGGFKEDLPIMEYQDA